MAGTREMRIEEVFVTPTLNKDGLFAVVLVRGESLLLASSIMIPEVLDAKKLDRALVKDNEVECQWPLSPEQDIEDFRNQCIGANIVLYSRKDTKSYTLSKFEVKPLEKAIEVELQRGLDARGIINSLWIYALVRTQITSEGDSVGVSIQDKSGVLRNINLLDQALGDVSLRLIIQNIEAALLQLDGRRKERFAHLVAASFKEFFQRTGKKYKVDEELRASLELLPTFPAFQEDVEFVKQQMLLTELHPLLKNDLLEHERFANIFRPYKQLSSSSAEILTALWNDSELARTLLHTFFDGKERLYDTSYVGNSFQQQRKKKRTIRRFPNYKARLDCLAKACGLDPKLPVFVTEKKLILEKSVRDLTVEDDDVAWYEHEWTKLDIMFTMRSVVAKLLMFVGFIAHEPELAEFALSKIWSGELVPKLSTFPQVLPIKPSKNPMLHIPLENGQASSMSQAAMPLLYAILFVCDYSSLPGNLAKLYDYLKSGKKVVLVVYDKSKSQWKEDVCRTIESSLRDIDTKTNSEDKVPLDRLTVCLTRFDNVPASGYESSVDVRRQIEEICELAESEANVRIETAEEDLAKKAQAPERHVNKRGGDDLLEHGSKKAK